MANLNSVSPARLAACKILRRVGEGAYASVLLSSTEQELSPQDRGLTHELVMGSLRWQLWLDHVIGHYANRPVSGLDRDVLIILRLALYQLRFLSRIPASAAVNESVNLVRQARLRSADTFINAVLRRATREPHYDPASKISDTIEKMAVATSHPSWLIKRWAEMLGSEEAKAFARSNNEPAPIAFRVVNNRAETPDAIKRLRASGSDLLPSKIASGGWRIKGQSDLLRELVASGQIYIQDEASQLVAQVLNAKPGELVLDLCAAPGGKTTQIADGAADSATIIAADLHPHRLRMVIRSANLQGLKSIQCITLDGVQPLPFSEACFDRVLVDAPCSGTGTLRHNPEIRYRISDADIRDLSERQKRILFNASRVVKPGGLLVYSTCSVEPEEDEGVMQTFLEMNDNFEVTELLLDSSMVTSYAARTWPHRHGADAFFICAFQRRNS